MWRQGPPRGGSPVFGAPVRPPPARWRASPHLSGTRKRASPTGLSYRERGVAGDRYSRPSTLSAQTAKPTAETITKPHENYGDNLAYASPTLRRKVSPFGLPPRVGGDLIPIPVRGTGRSGRHRQGVPGCLVQTETSSGSSDQQHRIGGGRDDRQPEPYQAADSVDHLVLYWAFCGHGWREARCPQKPSPTPPSGSAALAGASATTHGAAAGTRSSSRRASNGRSVGRGDVGGPPWWLVPRPTGGRLHCRLARWRSHSVPGSPCAGRICRVSTPVSCR